MHVALGARGGTLVGLHLLFLKVRSVNSEGTGDAARCKASMMVPILLHSS